MGFALLFRQTWTVKSLDKPALIGIDVTECVQNMTTIPVTGAQESVLPLPLQAWSCPGCLGIIDQGTGISGHAAVLQYTRRHTLYCNTGDCTLTFIGNSLQTVMYFGSDTTNTKL